MIVIYFLSFMKNLIICLAMWMFVNVGYSAFKTDEVSSVTVPGSCATTGSGKSVFKTIEEHLSSPMNSQHRILIEKAFRDKAPAQRLQSVHLVASLLDRKIHPCEFYQFLLLANHFKSDAESQLRCGMAGLEEICSTKVAENLELGFAPSEGKEAVLGEEKVVSWVEYQRYLVKLDEEDLAYKIFLYEWSFPLKEVGPNNFILVNPGDSTLIKRPRCR